jgi:hypothetical protein
LEEGARKTKVGLKDGCGKGPNVTHFTKVFAPRRIGPMPQASMSVVSD